MIIFIEIQLPNATYLSFGNHTQIKRLPGVPGSLNKQDFDDRTVACGYWVIEAAFMYAGRVAA